MNINSSVIWYVVLFRQFRTDRPIAHGEGHTKIDVPAPVQPSDSPPVVKDQTSAPHVPTPPAQTTSVYGRHQSVRYIEENTRSQADTGY